MPDWISDTLCRLATGGGFATRQLYTDQEEALFDAMRPIVLNGIEDIIGRPDLADRSIFLTLENISKEKRKAETEFWEDFSRAHPRILGALLDGVVHGLRELPNASLSSMPRMADFALWATACETAFWEAGTFIKAYDKNRDDAIATVIEADLVATAAQSFMDEQAKAEKSEWSGTSTDLLAALRTEDRIKLKEWPSSPRALSGRVRRAAATLREIGIEVIFDKSPDRKRNRIIKLVRQNNKGEDRPLPSDRPNPQPANDIGADGRAHGRAATPSALNALKGKASDGADGADANSPSLTAPDDVDEPF